MLKVRPRVPGKFPADSLARHSQAHEYDRPVRRMCASVGGLFLSSGGAGRGGRSETPELALQDLAGRVPREVLEEHEVARHFGAGEALARPRFEARLVERAARLLGHERADALA